MNKIEIFIKCIELNKTLCEAFHYIDHNAKKDLSIISTMEDALKTLSSNLDVLLDNEKRAKLKPLTNELVKAFKVLKSSKLSENQFIKSFNNWENICFSYLYVDAIIAASTCGTNEKPRALELLEMIISEISMPEIKSLASFVLSRILSKEQPLRSYRLGIEAFELNKNLAQNISSDATHVYHYVYNKIDEVYFDCCPICGEKGTPFYCATAFSMVNYTPSFSPLKLWMQCDSCGQLFSYNFPRKMVEPCAENEELGDETYMQPKLHLLPIFGDILKRLQAQKKGNRLLEVGAGAGELIAAAQEMGLEVEAIDHGSLNYEPPISRADPSTTS